MILLLITICAGPGLYSCEEPKRLGQFETVNQCQTVAAVHRRVLGQADNYRLECQPKDKK